MLKRFVSDRNRVFAVGDDDQAIYGFRGADISTILTFESHFPGADIVKLEINYRSTPAILAAANKIFSDKPIKFRKILRSGRYPDDKINFGLRPVKHLSEDTAAMIEWIKETGKSIEKKDAIPFSQMALLFRVNESLDHVHEDMEKKLGNESPLPRFITIHGSKGLEFPVVFLCDLEEGIFPNYRISKTHRVRSWADLFRSMVRRAKIKNPEFDYEEERRLFYVGVTRAEKYLYLLSVKKKYIRGRIIPLRESRFLKFI
jgi:superfamily I DNA/RNA helicase